MCNFSRNVVGTLGGDTDLGVDGAGFCTLGHGMIAVVGVTLLLSLFLGKDGISFGTLSVLCKVFANSRRVFRVSSPALRIGAIFVVGGDVKIFIISIAACLKKSSVVTLGKGM